MKFIKYTLVLLFSAGMLIACKGNETSKEVKSANTSSIAKLETVSVDIKGMTCAIGCAKTIESKLLHLEGITESKVDFESGKGSFTYDANTTSKDAIVSKINGLLDGKTYSASLGDSSCKPNCEKACCSVKKALSCEPGCEKSCCTTNKESKMSCEPGCEKACCTTKK
ncbi:cation transporter [Flavobacteriaceae bacterium]|nr:cation transporter [Flavobacteriaceae bacterium]